MLNEQNFTVLIAEDEHIIFLCLAELLSKYNCSVLHADNGKKALEILKQNPSIDLILMDINMPIMGGFEALDKIRSMNIQVPIIAQSGLVMESDREKILEAGFDDCIPKPISELKLTSMINKYLIKTSATKS